MAPGRALIEKETTMIVLEKRTFEKGFLVDKRETAAELFASFLGDLDREALLLLCLDCRLRPLALLVVYVGTVRSCLASPRDIFRQALLNDATSIMIAHNHPSGDPEPSDADAKVTHLVLGDGCFYSFDYCGVVQL